MSFVLPDAGYRISSPQSSLLRTAGAAKGLDSSASPLCPVIKQNKGSSCT